MKLQYNQNVSRERGFMVPLIIAIVALLAVGGYAYEKQKTAKQSPRTNEVSTETQTQEINTDVSANTQMSLRDLLSLSSPQECAVTFTTQNVETKGTVKVAQGKVRADYETVVNGKPWNVHALLDGSNSYTWMDGMPQGFKIALSSDAVQGSGAQTQGTDVNQKMNVVCKAWNVDTSFFSLPTNVDFMTVGGAGAAGSVTIPSGLMNAKVKSN